MAKQITRIVLTGGPAAGKTTLISCILKEFKQSEGWRVITVPDSAAELISRFGIRPGFGGITSAAFARLFVGDQLHKQALAMRAAELAPEAHVIVLFNRALPDVRLYCSEDRYQQILTGCHLTQAQVMAGYDAVLHLVSCAKGAETAYPFIGSEAYCEPVETAREKDDLLLQVWRSHPGLHVIDNSADFEEKIARSMRAVCAAVGRPVQQEVWHKYLISLPTRQTLEDTYHAVSVDMMQTYLTRRSPDVVRRIRQQRSGEEYLYFYMEKRTTSSGQWETETPISEADYIRYLMEGDMSLHTVHKTKYRFSHAGCRFEIDVYPFSQDRAIMRAALPTDVPALQAPPEIHILREVTDDPAYKNRQLAKNQCL